MLKKYADVRKALGVCLKCGKPVGRKDRVTCADCIKYWSAAKRVQRKQLEADGLCVVCGKVKVDPPYKTCPACREYNRQAKERSRQKKLAQNQQMGRGA